MSDTDISQLADESLSTGVFPAGRKSPFRLYFDSTTHQSILNHASADTSVEICGVLVGQWQRDDDGPFAAVSDLIRCDNATQGQAEVTFTHESWNHINSEMDSKYSELRIVGWYHSHPDFGIFLSDRDIFIQEHFFGGPGQVALVVDPVRKLEGVFEWRGGKPVLMDHYAIGDRIESVAASRTQESSRLVNRDKSADAGSDPAAHVAGRRDSASTVTTMLSWLCLFLLGWLVSGMFNHSRAYQSWAIERYGLWNILQLGRNDELTIVRSDIEKIQSEASALSEQHLAAATDGSTTAAQTDELKKRWKEVLDRLSVSQRNVERMQTLYALSPQDEQLALVAVVNQLRQLRSSDGRMMVPIPVPERLYPLIVNQLMPPQKDATSKKTEDKPDSQDTPKQPDTQSPNTKPLSEKPPSEKPGAPDATGPTPAEAPKPAGPPVAPGPAPSEDSQPKAD